MDTLSVNPFFFKIRNIYKIKQIEMSDVNEKGNLMNKFEKPINENVGEVEEAKYSKTATAMIGLRPFIKTIAILTAENPHAKIMSKEFNREANSKLLDDFRALKLGYKKIKGSYSEREEDDKSPIVEENSFIVNNISMESAIKLGTKYKQESIIYAETGNVAKDGSIAMTFRLIGPDKDKPEDYRKNIATPQNVFINRDNEEEFYSRIGNRKFMIPFFGVTEYLVRKDGKYILGKNEKRIAKKELDYDDSKWEGGAVSPLVTTVIKNKKGNPMSDKKIKKLENRLKDGKWEDYDVIKDKDGNPMSDEKIKELENRINELAESCIRKSGVPALGSRVDFARLLRVHQDYIKFVE
jgi:hypothetical protein